MMWRWRSCLLMFGLGLALSAGALDPASQAIPTFRIQGVKEGLPHGTVHALAFDPQGRLWAATADGIAQFNGRSWTNVPLAFEARSRYARALAFAPDGDLWVGTQEDGLWQRHGVKWIHHDGPRGLAAKRINGLLVEPGKGGYTVWAATGDQGVARFQEGRWECWGTREGLPDPWVWRVRRIGNHHWFLTLKGCVRWEAGHIVKNTLGADALGGEINDVLELPGAEGKGGGLWLSQWGKGLAHWNGKSWNRLGPGLGFPSKYPVTLASTQAPDGDQVLWVGTYDAGLFWRKGDGAWENLGSKQGFPATGVYALLPDPRGRPLLWAGLRISGLAALEMAGWRTLSTLQGLPSNRVLAMTAGTVPGQSSFWIGTELGLGRWEGGRWTIADTSAGLPSPLVNVFLESRAFGAPRMLTGTLEGLAAFEQGRWRLVAGKDQLASLQVNALAERETAQGRELWIGTEGGLTRYRKGRWDSFTTAEGLPHNWVYALAHARDAQGEDVLWVGTRGGGVAQYRKGVWTPLGLEAGLPNAAVYCLLVEPLQEGRHRLWAGTFGGGLAWLEPDLPSPRWQQLQPATDPGLSRSAVVSLVRDARGRFFAGTPRGLIRIEGEGIPGPHWATRLYTEGDGLPSRVCNAQSAYVDGAGRIWVGTAEGLGIFNPAEEPVLAPLGQPVLESITQGVRPIATSTTIEIPHGRGPLEISYVLPAYYRTEDLRYRTQVLGLEDAPTSWVPEGRREFTGLGAGRYVLRVEAMDPLGRITPSLDVPFRIRPEPWRSPLALTLYAFTLVMTVLGIHRLRVNWLEANNRDLSNRVAAAVALVETQKSALQEANQSLVALDQTKSRMIGIVAHDLRNPLNVIMLNATFLDEDDLNAGEAREVGQKIQSTAVFMNDLLARFLDLDAIESGRLKLTLCRVDPQQILAQAMETHTAKAALKGIELQLEAPKNLPMIWADRVYAQEIVDNLLSNSIKFTPKGPPLRKVTLRAGPGWFQIQDEGPGFTAEDCAKAFGQFVKLTARPTGGEPSTGLGLSIVKALAEHMGGSVELQSRPGEGACFTVRLPLAPADAPELESAEEA